MAKISRREFASLCGGALAVGGLAATWPRMARAAETASSEDQLTSLSLVEASAKIHSKAVTPTQLTKAVLARIAVYDPKINAYITVMSDQALQQAAKLDEEQKAGKFRGPLHGIPIALKDNIDTAGTRTTAASLCFATASRTRMHRSRNA